MMRSISSPPPEDIVRPCTAQRARQALRHYTGAAEPAAATQPWQGVGLPPQRKANGMPRAPQNPCFFNTFLDDGPAVLRAAK